MKKFNFYNDLVADNGAVITIQENPYNFIVSTLYTPRSGTQPFSGKRMWGIRTNQSGNIEIFTRGIDTARPSDVIELAEYLPLVSEWGCADLDYFVIADRTWKNFQDKVHNFIIESDGASRSKVPYVKHLNF